MTERLAYSLRPGGERQREAPLDPIRNPPGKRPGSYTSEPSDWQRLIPVAKRMRREPTPAEKALWERLRRKALGVGCRQQHPIGGYVPDFVCLSRTQVVEVDGEIHATSEDRDQNRDAYLGNLGYAVIRFQIWRVDQEIDLVVSEIAAVLRTRPDVAVDGNESEA